MILPTGYSYSPKEDLLYIAMERCGSKFVRNCFTRVDPDSIHNFDDDCYLPDITNNLLAVMRNPTHRLISAWELMYLTDRESPNRWFFEQKVAVPWMPSTFATADECVYAFQDFVMSLGDLNEIVELDKFVRPQCHWYTSTDIEYIDIGKIECHLGLEDGPISVEKKTSITASEYMSGTSQHHQQILWDIFEEDYLKLDYNIVPGDKYN